MRTWESIGAYNLVAVLGEGSKRERVRRLFCTDDVRALRIFYIVLSICDM